MCDKFNGKDPYKLLEGIDDIYNGNERKRKRYEAWDKWDLGYGVGKLTHEVYALCYDSKPGVFKYGPLTLYNKPFYIGQGKIGRSIESAAVGRQRDKGGEKVYHLEKMKRKRQKVKIVILGRFYTEKKAKVVELKLLNTIPKSELVNSEFYWCPLPLKSSDIIQPVLIMTC